jgi:hypothetical protein
MRRKTRDENRRIERKEPTMAKKDPAKKEDETKQTLPLSMDDLPVNCRIAKDENGFALILTAKDKRIARGDGKLVDELVVRIADGKVPRIGHPFPVRLSDTMQRTVTVADARLDEHGAMTVVSQEDGRTYKAVHVPSE